VSERSYQTMTAGKAGRHSRKLARRRTRDLNDRKYYRHEFREKKGNDYKRKKKEMDYEQI